LSRHYAYCRDQAELIHRFNSGRPANSIHIKIPPDNLCPIIYEQFGETIAWTSNADSTVIVMNLCSGKSSSFTGQGREKIQKIFLSSQLVAFFTFTGVLYASNLITGQRKSFRLPSARTPIVSCREKTIAGVLTDEYTAFVWDFDGQKCRTFDLRNAPHENAEVNRTDVLLQ
jgi:hypothetical protein